MRFEGGDVRWRRKPKRRDHIWNREGNEGRIFPESRTREVRGLASAPAQMLKTSRRRSRDDNPMRRSHPRHLGRKRVTLQEHHAKQVMIIKAVMGQGLGAEGKVRSAQHSSARIRRKTVALDTLPSCRGPRPQYEPRSSSFISRKMMVQTVGHSRRRSKACDCGGGQRRGSSSRSSRIQKPHLDSR